MPQIKKPNRLVNRSAGLYSGGKAAAPKQETVSVPAAEIDKIAEQLQHLAVPLDQLIFDPQNARVHNERNLEAIKGSLSMYGQVKPLVVRRETNVVVAGNGTLEAAKALGWTKLAVTMVDMTEVEAAGYGLADNRTAELAKWDFSVVARIEKLLHEQGHNAVGWTDDELEVLRAADWSPPPVDDTDFGTAGGGSNGSDQLLLGFTPDQFEHVSPALDLIRTQVGDDNLAADDCIVKICQEWFAAQEGGK